MSRRGRLDIHLQKSTLTTEIGRGAVARIIPLGAKAKKATTLVIPAGTGKTSASVNVAPGKYLVETRLPSGSIVRQSVDVAPRQKPQTIALEATPGTWMSAQAPAQVAPKRPRPTKGGTAVHAIAIDRMRADTWEQLHLLARSAALPTVDQLRTAFGSSLPERVTPERTGAGSATYLWSADYGLPQTVIVVERPGTVELVPIPVPWRTFAGGVAEIECTVPADPSAVIRCAVRDPDFGPVLGHLASGSVADARLLLDQRSLQWLEHKRENPYAAALGACVLIKAEATGKPQPWDPWVDNLARWFPSLPDGAALQGVRRLQRARKRKDLAGVGEAFEATLARGVPIFAPIAAMFLDGLATLVADPSFDSGTLDDRLPAVRAVMLRMQSGHAFTVLRFEAKGKTKQ